LDAIPNTISAAALLFGFLFAGFWWTLNRELRFKPDRRHFKYSVGLLLLAMAVLAVFGIVRPLLSLTATNTGMTASYRGVVIALIGVFGYMLTELGHYRVFQRPKYATSWERFFFWLTIVFILTLCVYWALVLGSTQTAQQAVGIPETGMKTSDVVALFALIVAFAALAISYWQGSLVRKHNRVSVAPHLSFSISLGDHPLPFGVHLINNGLGPAFITDFMVVIDGKRLHRPAHLEWPKAWRAVGYTSPAAAFHFFEIGDAIPAGGRFPLVTLDPGHADQGEATALRNALQRIDLVVAYESGYQELYSISLATVASSLREANHVAQRPMEAPVS